ncbi:MAG: hypothetical protein H6718_31075 [Polyangiaceae bacterium]|nr:hypothetical protein [Polyangiaceae bacterium]MCB9610410.1 hypothetical protein [Polyangiaceae bacterium]
MVQGEGFVAQCQHCGAAQQIVLGAALSACHHCRSTAPLPPAEAQRVAEAALLVGRVAVHEHRRLLFQRLEAETMVVLGLASSGGSWLVLGGAAFFISASTLPDGVGVVDALLGGAPDSPGATWAMFALLLGAALSASILCWAFVRFRKSSTPPRALPPLQGGAPRCRLCGGGLGSAGSVRVCRYCGASNLIDGSALRVQVGTLLDQLGELRVAEHAAANRADSAVFSAAKLSALGPIFLPLGAAVLGDLSGVWFPVLLLLLPLAGLPGAIALCVLLFTRAHRVRRFSETRPGDVVRIAGQAFRVHAVMWLYPSANLGEQLRLVAPEGTSAPTLALHVQEYPEDTGQAFAVAAGGERSAGALPPHARVSIWNGGSPQLSVATDGESVRIFQEGSAVGAAPWWTLKPTQIDPRTVFVP